MTQRRYWFCLGVWAAFFLLRGNFEMWDELETESRTRDAE